MSFPYTPYTWNDDEVITKEKLNNLEQGLAESDTTIASGMEEVTMQVAAALQMMTPLLGSSTYSGFPKISYLGHDFTGTPEDLAIHACGLGAYPDLATLESPAMLVSPGGTILHYKGGVPAIQFDCPSNASVQLEQDWTFSVIQGGYSAPLNLSTDQKLRAIWCLQGSPSAESPMGNILFFQALLTYQEETQKWVSEEFGSFADDYYNYALTGGEVVFDGTSVTINQGDSYKFNSFSSGSYSVSCVNLVPGNGESVIRSSQLADYHTLYNLSETKMNNPVFMSGVENSIETATDHTWLWKTYEVKSLNKNKYTITV